jgi:transposase
MLLLPQSVKIYLATAPTDMRKGFDTLAALVEQDLGQDVYSGHLFVFVSKRANRIKILTWVQGGFVLWYKRLERGRFKMPFVDKDSRSVKLDSGQLAMLLDGIDYSRVRRPRRWHPPARKRRPNPVESAAITPRFCDLLI